MKSLTTFYEQKYTIYLDIAVPVDCLNLHTAYAMFTVT